MHLRLGIIAMLVTTLFGCFRTLPSAEAVARQQKQFQLHLAEIRLAERVEFSFDGRSWIEREPLYTHMGFEQHYEPAGPKLDEPLEMVTVAFYFPDASRNSIWEFILYKRGVMESTCPGIDFTVLTTSEEQAMVSWSHSGCQALRKGGASGVAAFFRGEKGFHQVSYAYAAVTLPAKERATWLGLLRKARLVKGAA